MSRAAVQSSHFAISAMSACPPTWNATLSGCYKRTAAAYPHAGCISACGPGASLACFGSAEEFGHASSLVDQNERIWLGPYQWPVNEGADVGWDYCASGEPLTYMPPWHRYAPSDVEEHMTDCVMLSEGVIDDYFCDMPLPCLCEWGGNGASADYLAVADVLGTSRSLWSTSAAVRAHAARTYTILVFVVLLPALLVACWKACSQLVRGRRRRYASEPAAPQNKAPGLPQHKAPGLPLAASSEEVATSAEIALAKSANAQSALRLRVSGIAFQLGWTFMVFANSPALARLLASSQFGVTAPMQTLRTIPGLGHHVYQHMLCLLPVAIVTLNLALLPTDRRLINGMCGFACGFMALVGAAFALQVVDSAGRFSIRSSFVCLSALISACILSPTLCCSCCCGDRTMPPRAKLLRLWFAVRLWFVSMGSLLIISTFIINAIDNNNDYDAMFLNFGFLIGGLIPTPHIRGRFTRALGSLGSVGDERQQAAACASLIGGRSPGDALVAAKSAFRVLPFSELALEDFASNSDSGLASKTRPAALGECDAFLSHSWRDDGTAKYEAVAAWAKALVEGGQAKPTLWLDKACIDQNNIDASLAGLPVFLSGCKQLLAVIGETYTQRLWCVMELFVFVKMGGTPDRLVVRLIGKADALALTKFEAEKAQCFLKHDRQRLLAVVEASFGDLYPFNKVVRKLLADKDGSERLGHRQWV